jgi:hypothetical protein
VPCIPVEKIVKNSVSARRHSGHETEETLKIEVGRDAKDGKLDPEIERMLVQVCSEP